MNTCYIYTLVGSKRDDSNAERDLGNTKETQ